MVTAPFLARRFYINLDELGSVRTSEGTYPEMSEGHGEVSHS